MDLNNVHSYSEEHTNFKECIYRINISSIKGLQLPTTPYNLPIPFNIFCIINVEVEFVSSITRKSQLIPDKHTLTVAGGKVKFLVFFCYLVFSFLECGYCTVFCMSFLAMAFSVYFEIVSLNVSLVSLEFLLFTSDILIILTH